MKLNLFFVFKVLFSHWIEDALTVIDQLTEGPVILVGTGIGAWISLLAAQEIGSREEVERNSAANDFSFPSKLHGLGMYNKVETRCDETCLTLL